MEWKQATILTEPQLNDTVYLYSQLIESTLTDKLIKLIH